MCTICRRKVWRIALRRDDLMKCSVKSLKNCVVCSEHFSDDAYMCAAERHTSSRLTHTAVSTLFSHSNPPKVTTERKPPAVRHVLPPVVKLSTENVSSDEAQEPLVQHAPGIKPALIRKSTCRGDVHRLQQRLDRLTAKNKRLTESPHKCNATSREIQRHPPAMASFKPRQRAFLNARRWSARPATGSATCRVGYHSTAKRAPLCGRASRPPPTPAWTTGQDGHLRPLSAPVRPPRRPERAPE